MALPDDAHIGGVSLTVRNLERSVAFYRDVLGFRVGQRTAVEAALSADGARTLIELHERADAVPRPRHCISAFVQLNQGTGAIRRQGGFDGGPLSDAEAKHISIERYRPFEVANGEAHTSDVGVVRQCHAALS